MLSKLKLMQLALIMSFEFHNLIISKSIFLEEVYLSESFKIQPKLQMGIKTLFIKSMKLYFQIIFYQA